MSKENKANLVSAIIILACAIGFFVRGRYILGAIGAVVAAIYIVMVFTGKKK
ncbi:MAG: hypothetical protein Q4F12_02525 [Erysipelotrichaceae bacterium]|nr:hypothetical protein [Erysipelotrichaceae bacterium]